MELSMLTTAAAFAVMDPTPPMGWRSWNLYGSDVSQQLLEAQIIGMTRRKHSINGKPTSLLDLGYSSIGLDDGWQACGTGVNGSYHDANGQPLVNHSKFPSFSDMTAAGHAANLTMGWYGNNCGCHEIGKVGAYYTQDAKATVAFGFDATKIDSCGPSGNVTAWRTELNKASAAAGKPNVEIENCRNYRYVDELTKTSDCEAQLFRSTEDNSPDFLSIMANLMTNARLPGTDKDPHGGLPITHPGCWSYPDMLEIMNTTCDQNLKNGTCGAASTARRGGGLSTKELQTHFSAWCIVSSPLVLGHDMADDASYDTAWPIVSNADAIAVNQEVSGNDYGRLVAVSNKTMIQDVYHGKGCECVWLGNPLPQWAVYAKRLNVEGTKAAVLAINLGDTVLSAGAISVSYTQIFGAQSVVAVGSAEAGYTSTRIIVEYDLWKHAETPRSRGMHVNHVQHFDGGNAGDVASQMWTSPELGPQSSFFATLELVLA